VSCSPFPRTFDHEDLATELQQYAGEFAAVRRDAERLVDNLTEAQIDWRENEASWSIGDCLNHLAVTGTLSVVHIRSAIAETRARGLLGSGPFSHPVPGRLLIWLMDAPPRIRFRAPKPYRPLAGCSVPQVLSAFFALQDDVMRVLREANGVDLASVKVVNPVTSWLRLTIGQELAFTAAHERRHLWQAWKVRSKVARRL
jgi:hypothetical protein